jgi:dihydroflavonol-4-reductase
MERRLSLVTGANGHVGYNLVRMLAHSGMPVRATVRDATNAATAGPLRELPGVEVVSLDIRDRGRFCEVAKGVDTLFHVAATYKIYAGGKAGEEEMVRDSVDGASAAIEAAAASGIRKVVLTSSIVTLPLVNAGAPAPTEDDWREDLSVPYYRAKTLGEREAWRLASERGVKLVTILPGFVLGPPFLRRTTSLDIVYGMMLGVLRFGTLDVHLATPVDVRDVARAHILAATRECNGRFIVANDRTYSYLELSRIMHSIDPAIPRAPFVLPNAAARAVNMFDWLNGKMLGAPRVYTTEAALQTVGRQNTGSNQRAKAELGWTPEIPFEQSLRETMAALKNFAAERS